MKLPRALFLLCLAILPLAAEQNQLDGNENLFTVMAALNAAGYDAGLNTPGADPLRSVVRQTLAAKSIPVLPEIKAFFKANPGVGPYISLALATTPAPQFAFRTRTVDIPPDAYALERFLPLLTRFYEQAEIAALWKKVQPAHDGAIERYHLPLTALTQEVNSYFRNPNAGYLGRRFLVYVDLLGAPGQVQSRSFGDDYFVVVTPSNDLRSFDIRHGYLHFLVEPLVAKFGLVLMKKAALTDYAAPAPLLDESYKLDFVLLSSECLIRAVESRMDRKPDSVNDSLHQGFILTPFFAEQLVKYEKQPTAMRLYFTEMLDALDSRHESQRLANIVFTAKPAASASVEKRPAVESPITPSARANQLGEQLYQAKQFEEAREQFLKSLKEKGEAADHAGAYYGLARIALQVRNPELAELLLQKTLESGPSPFARSWSLVYLGRLSDTSNDRTQAAKYYEAALAVEGASDEARKAAEKGIQNTFKK